MRPLDLLLFTVPLLVAPIHAYPTPAANVATDPLAVPEGSTHFARSVPEILAQKAAAEKRDAEMGTKREVDVELDGEVNREPLHKEKEKRTSVDKERRKEERALGLW